MKGLKGLKAARRAAKMTQAKLSLQIGISVTAISLFENGKLNPTLETLRALCTALNASADFLVNGEVCRVD
ncbi:MAG: helix-turn-helix transcriptional regulator [bacterium]|nr:helix-turn-helix transcriptional regulator [bacterium]